MSDRIFLDTNIFIYLYSESEVNKRNVVYQLFDHHHCVNYDRRFG